MTPATENDPALQTRHSSDIEVLLNFPCGQRKHCDDPFGAYFPALQTLHAFFMPLEYLPASQSVHVNDANNEYLPGGHATQVTRSGSPVSTENEYRG